MHKRILRAKHTQSPLDLILNLNLKVAIKGMIADLYASSSKRDNASMELVEEDANIIIHSHARNL